MALFFDDEILDLGFLSRVSAQTLENFPLKSHLKISNSGGDSVDDVGEKPSKICLENLRNLP